MPTIAVFTALRRQYNRCNNTRAAPVKVSVVHTTRRLFSRAAILYYFGCYDVISFKKLSTAFVYIRINGLCF